MPMIRVELFPGRSADQKRRFAKAVTDSFVEICGSTPEAVHVVFVEVAKDDWATPAETSTARLVQLAGLGIALHFLPGDMRMRLERALAGLHPVALGA
ncbi:MAG: tautomerase family protein, partial [Alphaproteobacteria bacterium]